jgi:DNA polymerase-3 subunit delta
VFYLFHGENEYSRSLELARMKSKLGDPTTVELNTTTIDGTKATLDEFIFACDAAPFLAEKRLVIVNDLAARFEPRPGGARRASEQDIAFLQRLEELVTRLPQTTRLVFVERREIKQSNPIYKLASKSDHGYVHRFTPPKGGALDRWISTRVREKGGRIEPRAVNLLATFVGNDLRLLDQELDKLLTHVGQERPIARGDVELLVSYVREADIFEMVDALGRRDIRRAMKLVHQLLEDGQHPLYLLHMITRQFRILLQIKELLAKGTSHEDIGALLSLHPYVAAKMTKQAPSFSIAELETIYHRLLELEVAVKTGEMEERLALSLFVGEMQRQV